MPVRTLVYIGGPEGARELEAHFPEFKFPMFSGNMGADVVEQEASKAEGLKRLCQYYDIGLEQTVAFGDSMNDYEIVREAGKMCIRDSHVSFGADNTLDGNKDDKGTADQAVLYPAVVGAYNSCVGTRSDERHGKRCV